MTEKLPTILEKIIAEKHREIATRSKATPIELIEHVIVEQDDTPRGFFNALQKKREAGLPAVIAEVKKASPSKGVIREDFNPTQIAKSYEAGGTACLSVLTDEKFFQGSEHYLHEAREATTLPVIRKDFIIDDYQVFEARAMGADCILLIAACLTRAQMASLTDLAQQLGMDVLIEVHNLAELESVAGLPVRMIGINNRNLHTFEVSLNTTFELAKLIPPEIMVVTESGIATADDVRLMLDNDIGAFLVGEAFMRCDNPGQALSQLFGVN